VRVHPELLEREQLPAEAKGRRVAAAVPEINDWERYLVQNGIVVVKLFLHLSYEEQCRRFLRRIDNPSRNWKFSVSDIEDAGPGMPTRSPFPRCSRDEHALAPWHVLPADHKWFTAWRQRRGGKRTLAIDPRYPDVEGPSRRRWRRRAPSSRRSVEATALTGPPSARAWPLGGKAVFLSSG